jgi:2-dehydropantoate 2-reductase
LINRQSFTVVGAGAIGAVVGVHLMRAGHDVVFVEANAEHVTAIRDKGLRLTGVLEATVAPVIFEPHEVDGRHCRVLLAVKSSQTENALAPMVPHLAPDGYVLSLQNGLEELKIARMVGAARTIGAFLTFGGHYEGPGEVRFTGRGSFRVGEVDGRATRRVVELSQILSALQPVEVTDNIMGCLWAKMALGAVYFATATVNADVTEVYDRGIYLGVLGNLVGEVVDVANAAGVTPEAFDGFDAQVFSPQRPRDPASVDANWVAQKAYWNGLSQGRTGVWRDLAVHRRKTEADELLGSVKRAADGHQMATPRVDALISIIHEIENGRRELGWNNLDSLAQLDRALT